MRFYDHLPVLCSDFVWHCSLIFFKDIPSSIPFNSESHSRPHTWSLVATGDFSLRLFPFLSPLFHWIILSNINNHSTEAINSSTVYNLWALWCYFLLILGHLWHWENQTLKALCWLFLIGVFRVIWISVSKTSPIFSWSLNKLSGFYFFFNLQDYRNTMLNFD